MWDVTGALQGQAAANEVIKPSSSANGGLRDGLRGNESKLNGQRSNPFPKPPLSLYRIAGFGANPPEVWEHRAYLRACHPRTTANICKHTYMSHCTRISNHQHNICKQTFLFKRKRQSRRTASIGKHTFPPHHIPPFFAYPSLPSPIQIGHYEQAGIWDEIPVSCPPLEHQLFAAVGSCSSDSPMACAR